MNIGLHIFHVQGTPDLAMLAQKAESLGFESIWVPEHMAIPVTTSSVHPMYPDGAIPTQYSQVMDPFVNLARASAVTSTLKLATGVCLVPQHHPLHLAKQVATLDFASGGRFLFGVGAGWVKEQSEMLGGDFEHRWTQAREYVDAMKAVWANDVAEYHGRWVDFPPVMAFPKPVQKPHPPIYLGGKAPNVLKRVVAWADGWLPPRTTPEEIRVARATLDQLATEAGRDPSSIDISVWGLPGQMDSPEVVRDFEAAGANRVIAWVRHAVDEGATAELEEIAGAVGL